MFRWPGDRLGILVLSLSWHSLIPVCLGQGFRPQVYGTVEEYRQRVRSEQQANGTYQGLHRKSLGTYRDPYFEHAKRIVHSTDDYIRYCRDDRHRQVFFLKLTKASTETSAELRKLNSTTEPHVVWPDEPEMGKKFYDPQRADEFTTKYQARTWTLKMKRKNPGVYDTVNGVLILTDNKQVIISQLDGTEIKLAISMLATSDQRLVRNYLVDLWENFPGGDPAAAQNNRILQNANRFADVTSQETQRTRPQSSLLVSA